MRHVVLVLFAAGCCCAGLACMGTAPPAPARPTLSRFDHDLPALGTRFHVTFFAPNAPAAADAAAAVSARLADVDAKLATGRADTELARFCAAAGGPPLKLSDELFTVLELSQRVAKASDGAFDVTAAPYLAVWRRAAEAGAEPTDEQLDAVRPLVGWKKLRLDSIERTASLESAGMNLDPAPLSYGYAADQVLDVLKRRGLERAFVETAVNAFGRVRVFGAPPPGEEGWGLEVPMARRKGRVPGAVPTVSDSAIASSSPGFVLDPLTGKSAAAADHRVAVVLGRTGATAAGLAAAAAVLGRDRGQQVVRTAGAAARFETPARVPSGPRKGASLPG